MPTGDDASKAQILDVADRLFAAIENTDIATVERMWSDDILVWRPGARRDDDKPRAAGDRVVHLGHHRAPLRNSGPPGLRQWLRWLRWLRWRRPGFVQQHVLHATGTAGQTIALRVCIVIKLDINGFINRIDEYFDPADIAVLLA